MSSSAFSFVQYYYFRVSSPPPPPRTHIATMACRYCRYDISSGSGVGAARQTPFQFRLHRTIIITGKLHSVLRFASRPRDAPPEIVANERRRCEEIERPRDNDRSRYCVLRLSGIYYYGSECRTKIQNENRNNCTLQLDNVYTIHVYRSFPLTNHVVVRCLLYYIIVFYIILCYV